MANFTILKNNKLITAHEWNNKICSFHSPFKENLLVKDKRQAKRLIDTSLKNAIDLRAKDNFGILFSGGLDSSLIALICKKLNKKFVCYSIGLENSSDLDYAKKAALMLDLELKIKELSIEEVEKYLVECIKLLNTKDVVKLEIAIVVYAGLEFAAKDKCFNIFAGNGSEEIFAGYERHINFNKEGPKKVYEECWNGLKSCYNRDIVRDYAIAKKFSCNLLLPFFDFDLIRNAMKIHPSLKVNENEKKIILREYADDLGLPKEIAYRKRTAAQYGSKISYAIQKLAKKKGFKYKQEYINSINI
ncbi:MAG: asparagine synthase-related protein [Nanoarchaeota archaeon]